MNVEKDEIGKDQNIYQICEKRPTAQQSQVIIF